MIQPALSLILGNLQYDSHVIDCHVSLGLLPHANHARLTLPASAQVSAGIGEDGALDLALDGDLSRVLSGIIEGIERRLDTISVLLTDAGRELSRTRASATYKAQDAGKVIRALSDEAGIEIGTIDADLPLVHFVAHQNATAAEHIARLAGLSGCLALISAEGDLEVIKRPGGPPDLALLYGREFIRYSAREVQPPRDQLILAGNGPAGDPSEPGAARHSSTPLPENSPTPGPAARYRPSPLLKTPVATVSAGQSRNTARAACIMTLTAHCLLLPQLHPGQVTQVQGLPDGLPEGPWLITGVHHRLHAGTAGATTLHAELADLSGMGLDALLGGALELVGGLL